jgi:hypothetical protein
MLHKQSFVKKVASFLKLDLYWQNQCVKYFENMICVSKTRGTETS